MPDLFGPVERYDPQHCPNRAHHPEGSLCLLCCPCPECEHERGW